MEISDRGERQGTNAKEAGYYSVEEAARVLRLTLIGSSPGREVEPTELLGE